MNDVLKKILKKEYGNVLKTGRQLLNAPKKVFSLGPKLDIGLNGGIPEGSWFIISGKPKLGKSSLSLDFAATYQAAGRTVYYLDVEGRLKEMNLNGIKGLDPDKLEIIQSEEGHILTAEEFLEIGKEIIKNDPGCLLIIDSVSAICPAAEMNEKISATGRASGPRLLASFCRQMANVVPIQRCTIVLMQHLIANTSGYGAKYMEDGGFKIQYQMDVKLRGKGFTKWENKEGVQIGQSIEWEVVTSALGPPGQKVTSYLRYNHGIDEVWEYIEIAMDLGLIEKSGSWMKFIFMGPDPEKTPKKPKKGEKEIEPVYKQVQGQDKVWQHFMDNPEDYDKLVISIKEMLA